MVGDGWNPNRRWDNGKPKNQRQTDRLCPQGIYIKITIRYGNQTLRQKIATLSCAAC